MIVNQLKKIAKFIWRNSCSIITWWFAWRFFINLWVESDLTSYAAVDLKNTCTRRRITIFIYTLKKFSGCSWINFFVKLGQHGSHSRYFYCSAQFSVLTSVEELELENRCTYLCTSDSIKNFNHCHCKGIIECSHYCFPLERYFQNQRIAKQSIYLVEIDIFIAIRIKLHSFFHFFHSFL